MDIVVPLLEEVPKDTNHQEEQLRVVVDIEILHGVVQEALAIEVREVDHLEVLVLEVLEVLAVPLEVAEVLEVPGVLLAAAEALGVQVVPAALPVVGLEEAEVVVEETNRN
ncbi:hypothetical protein MTsPCn9_30270 [Croceitalea sp. MTPC9]|nr:hypothetical protein MTsPCn6_21380 [Croceitalea sp. MTPC6]GMN18087.1 hypothetical protein MTsPCn9_30270 [Croceitalea sp. MTPC9]